MDLSLSGEQGDLVATVRRRLGAAAPAPAEAAGWELWEGIGELGVLEDEAGGGPGLVDQVLVADELGRGLLPQPYPMAAYLLPFLRAVDPGRLEEVRSGRAWGVLVGRRAFAREPSGVLTGRTGPVPGISPTSVVVVATEHPDGICLSGISQDDAAASVEAVNAFDVSRPAGTLTMHRIAESGSTVMPAAAFEELASRARVLHAAETLGAAGRVLELAVSYAQTRTTFGQPIGQYQGVSHPLADALVQLQGARSLVYWAAASLAEGLAKGHQLALAAMLRSTEVATTVSERALHTFGGIGFTWEHPAHLYYRRALVSRVAYDVEDSLRSAFGRELLAQLTAAAPAAPGASTPGEA